MALGFGGNTDWRDMSEYVVHLTGHGSGSTGTQLTSILTERLLRSNRAYGAAWNIPGLGDSQKVVSMSEIPLDHLKRLAERHGHEGLAFRKVDVLRNGGVPVWYLTKGTPLQLEFFNWVRQLAFKTDVVDAKHWIWKLTPFIDYPGSYFYPDGSPKAFEFTWEREWRCLDGYRFDYSEIAFVFAPMGNHPHWTQKWSSLTDEPTPPLLDMSTAFEFEADVTAEFEATCSSCG